MSVAHALGLKIPGLFIYYNVPSLVYQDRIIALLTIGWAAFFWITAVKMDRDLVKVILLMGAAAIAMLTVINLTTDFALLSEQINPRVYHAETGILFLYWMCLVLSFIKRN